jgi:hypothetical protein
MDRFVIQKLYFRLRNGLPDQLCWRSFFLRLRFVIMPSATAPYDVPNAVCASNGVTARGKGTLFRDGPNEQMVTAQHRQVTVNGFL